MALCCNKCYPICQPFASCPAEVLIYAPPSYIEESIIVNITKPGVNVNVQQLLGIDPDGYVLIDEEGLPDGFLNPYGGQYTISFNDAITKQPLTFTAMDGEEYDSICLMLQVTYTNDPTIQLIVNVFNNDQPEV